MVFTKQRSTLIEGGRPRSDNSGIEDLEFEDEQIVGSVRDNAGGVLGSKMQDSERVMQPAGTANFPGVLTNHK
jgi:hypothetical protein